ncbi:S-layer homology domain-containing protein [Paenibacillus curdlanolyticus]|nr:S-layer homology domain-containing protein [Paenibacillus curdlanolyticus]
MKKSLSLLVAVTMVVSMFASVASAADKELTTQEKFDALKALNIFSGYPPNGDAGLDKNMTRAQFAKVLGLLNELEENAAASKYVDVPANHWAKGFIGAVTEAKLMNGVGNNKFDPNGNVTVEALAKTLVLTLGLEPVEGAKVEGTSAWAAGYVQAALDAKLIDAVANYKVAAKRALLVEASYEYIQAQNPQVLKVSKASQTGAKKITLEFNKPVTKDIAIEAKYLSTTVAVTKKFADDLKSVVLEANYLPTGDIVVKAGDAEAVTVKVEAEKAAKVSITTESLQKAANQDLGIKKFNQFNEETSVGQAVYTNVYNTTKGKDLKAVLASGKLDLSNDDNAKVDDTIVVSVYTNDGLNDTKSFKVTAASSATKIELSAPAPLKDASRITVEDKGLVLPIKLADQYGKSVTLATYSTEVVNGQFNLSGITFLVGGDGEISTIKVDDKGVVTFTAKKAGNVIISASNLATGAYASTSFKIESKATLKEFKLQNPISQVIANEDVIIPFTAVDTYGNAIAGKDVNLADVTFVKNVDFVGAPYINAKGELVVKFAKEGSVTLQAFVTTPSSMTNSSVSFSVSAAKEYKSIQGLKDVASTFENGAVVTLADKNIQIVDNYGRVSTLDSVTGATYSVVSADPTILTYNNGVLEAKAAGSTKLTVKFNGLEKEIAVTVVKSEDIKSYEIQSVGTVYGNKDNTAAGQYAVEIKLNGKLSDGSAVALVNSAPQFVSSSDESVVARVGNKIFALKAGEATISASLASGKVAEVKVTASDAAPVATSVKFKEAEYKTTVGTPVALDVEVKDQYGVELAKNGFVSSTDKAVTTNGTLTVTGKEKGVAVVTYQTSNGKTATTTVLVN